MRSTKGFTLVEVLVSIAIIAIIGIMMSYAYIGSLKASNSLYIKEQIKLTSSEYMNYCSNNIYLPRIIDGNYVSDELHVIGYNLYNDGLNTRFSTFFGPIDRSTIIIRAFNGVVWSVVPALVTSSGSVNIVGIYEKAIISYNILDLYYIRDRRYNYGTPIVLSYIRPSIDFAITDDGFDIPISNINILSLENGQISINSNYNKWINIYYKIPRSVKFEIYRPDVTKYSISGNIINFNIPVEDHYVLVSYESINGIYYSEIVKASSLNQAIVSDSINYIDKIDCLTIECIAQYQDGKYMKEINSKMVIKK